jgi:hypothetical protein
LDVVRKLRLYLERIINAPSGFEAFVNSSLNVWRHGVSGRSSRFLGSSHIAGV